MLIHPMPSPVALWLGPLPLRWYGLMYVLAFAQFILLGRARLKQPHIMRVGGVKEDLDDMLFYGVLGVIVGGRLGEVFFYRPMEFLHNPLEIFMLWHGGMSFHGGFLGVLFAMWLWARRRGRKLADVYDFIAPLVPLGYAFGRLGNFINAELWGRVADPSLPWAMIWPPSGDLLPRHPSPIYQMLVDGVLLFVILWPYARKQRPRLAVGALFVALYGCARFFTEYFRTPDWEAHFAGVTITSGQMLSLPMIVGGFALLYWAYRHGPDAAEKM
jgi:phosphatidylglycerol:prolipoprotein diacylglycerol transferase